MGVGKRYGMSDAEFAKLVRAQAEVDAGINEFMAKQVVPTARQMALSQGAVDSGKYAASIKISQRARNGVGKVKAGRFTAAFIEFGTGEPGATKAFGVMEKTAQVFGGHLDTGAEIDQLDSEADQ